MPSGFLYQAELLTSEEQDSLYEDITALNFEPYLFRGFPANRKVAAFGYRYDYSTRRMELAPPLPPYLLDLRLKIASFASRSPDAFEQVLVTQYVPGTALAWHRDRLQYGEIVGLSLLAPAKFKLRRRVGLKWERAAITLEPRSVYRMSGEVRFDWEHSITAVDDLRYSLTFRTLSESFKETLAARRVVSRPLELSDTLVL